VVGGNLHDKSDYFIFFGVCIVYALIQNALLLFVFKFKPKESDKKAISDSQVDMVQADGAEDKLLGDQATPTAGADAAPGSSPIDEIGDATK